MRKSKLLLMILALVVVLAMAVGCNNDNNGNNGNGDNGNGNGGNVAPPPPGNGGAETPTPPPEPPPAPPREIPALLPGQVYALSSDVIMQQMDVGTRGTGTEVITSPHINSAGSPLFRIVEAPDGGNGIEVSMRSQGFYALDFVVVAAEGSENQDLPIDLVNNSYVLNVRGRMDGDGYFVIGGADSPWAWLANSQSNNGWFDVSFVMTYDSVMGIDDYPGTGLGDADRRHIRLAAQGYGDFVIHEITVTQLTDVIYSLSADPIMQRMAVGTRGTGEEVITSPHINSAGAPLYRIIETPDGNRGIEVSMRSQGHYALDFVVMAAEGSTNRNLPIDLENNTYVLNVRGRMDGEGYFIIGGADSPWAWLANSQSENGWFDVSFTMTYDSVMGIGDYPGTGLGDGNNRRHIRLQAQGYGDFSIHEITVTRQ